MGVSTGSNALKGKAPKRGTKPRRLTQGKQGAGAGTGGAIADTNGHNGQAPASGSQSGVWVSHITSFNVEEMHLSYIYMGTYRVLTGYLHCILKLVDLVQGTCLSVGFHHSYLSSTLLLLVALSDVVLVLSDKYYPMDP